MNRELETIIGMGGLLGMLFVIISYLPGKDTKIALIYTLIIAFIIIPACMQKTKQLTKYRKITLKILAKTYWSEAALLSIITATWIILL